MFYNIPHRPSGAIRARKGCRRSDLPLCLLGASKPNGVRAQPSTPPLLPALRCATASSQAVRGDSQASRCLLSSLAVQSGTLGLSYRNGPALSRPKTGLWAGRIGLWGESWQVWQHSGQESLALA